MKSVDLCRVTVAKDPIAPIDLPEFDARNPATVANSVGDIIGDVAGTSADFFGSFSQSTVAALGIFASSVNTLEMNAITPVTGNPIRNLWFRNPIVVLILLWFPQVISHWSVICFPLMLFQSGILVSTALYILTVSKSSPFNPRITSTKPTPEERNEETTYNIESALWKQVTPPTLCVDIQTMQAGSCPN